jgi:glucans biosynthesis protein
MRRRDLFNSVAALTTASWPWSELLAAAGTGTSPQFLGESEPFDYAALKGRARALADAPYRPPAVVSSPEIEKLQWDQYQSIRFRDDHSLWAGGRLPFQVRFFHLGLSFRTPVRMYEVVNGRAREVGYDPAMFDLSHTGIDASNLPGDLGFAGFRLYFHTDWIRDIAAFLGASYFRAVGSEMQYGQSARGLAVDCGLPRAEEFPMFTAFWLERPAPNAKEVTVYALLDSPSVAGAYRLILRPGERFVMDIDAALYPRKTIERIGIAPMTSMYQTGENDNRVDDDWRPEIHDTDGLQLWTGAGEWIWRPLVNPLGVHVSSFADDNPRGFGLMQRDRNFDHYLDDGVYYDRRPCVWVEPKSGWGKGAVMLVEIQTENEAMDNIVAFWNPQEKPQPGQELLFGYRLSWGANAPMAPRLATVQATHTGIGGVIGRRREYYSRRFAVDFAGGTLAQLDTHAKVEAVIEATRGEIEITSARPLLPIKGWRAMFDLKPTDDRTDPIDIRLYLRSGGQALTETWLYQWTPPTMAERAKELGSE